MTMTYPEFLDSKTQLGGFHGFDPIFMPEEHLFDFQVSLSDWIIRKGRGAVYADTGLGKSRMELVFGENVVRKTNRPVLLLTPLAVGPQMIAEADKIGVDAVRSTDGKFPSGARIVVSNYERMHYFNPADFAQVLGDESSCIKDFKSKRKAQVTEFMRTLKYRGLFTATAAPNDWPELGTAAEALGELGHQDMLSRFFTNKGRTLNPYRTLPRGGKQLDENKWHLKPHAERYFWRWVCSWARACRKPSDIGPFSNDRYDLPPLTRRMHVAKARNLADGFLFEMAAENLRDQAKEARRTLEDRCEKAAELASDVKAPSVLWCHLNDEGDLLEKLVSGAVQVSGADRDEVKEEKLIAFTNGQITKLVIKPEIGGFGLNWQHCWHQTYFPSHSFERMYQAWRRLWRFGQTHEVIVDLVTTEGGADILENMQRKAANADMMFSRLVELMNDALGIQRSVDYSHQEQIPSWL